MAQINARNIPDDLYHRVRLAAANGSGRLAKGALERLVIRALRRAVEDPMPGAGLPKLKLCARCVAANLEVMNRPKNTTVPGSAYTTKSISIETTLTPKPDPDLFAELLRQIEYEDQGTLANEKTCRPTPPGGQQE